MRQKVIVVTPGGSIFKDPLIRVFDKFGYEAIPFNSRSGIAYNPFFRSLSRSIPVLNYFKKTKVNSINRNLIDLVKKERPKYLFAQKAETISPETIDLIKNLGVITANCYNDCEWSVVSKIAPHYDYFFTQHLVLLERLWKEMGLKNCFRMHHGAEPMPDPFTGRVNNYQVSFVGTYNTKLYPSRENYLLAVKDFGLCIWGNNEWKQTSLGRNFKGRAHGDDRLRIYSQSKIVVDINWEHIQSEGVSLRPFEVAACGGCLFADTTKKDIKDVFKENIEFISFSNKRELEQKVQYYLNHDAEREKIAKAGYNRVMAEHTYFHRIGQFFDTIKFPEKYLYK